MPHALPALFAVTHGPTPLGGAYYVVPTYPGPGFNPDTAVVDQDAWCAGQVSYSVSNLNSFAVQPSIPDMWTVLLPPTLSLAKPGSRGYSTKAGK